MNYNRYLANSRRTDLWGGEVSTMNALHPHGQTDAPRMGLSGLLALGHECDITDLLVPRIEKDGREMLFTPLRHRWTPAHMTTVYRSQPEPDIYPVSGTLCVHETKCILSDNTFVSDMTLHNDRKVPARIRLTLLCPRISQGMLYTETRAAALMQTIPFSLYAHVGCTLGEGTVFEFTLPPLSQVSLRYALGLDPDSGENAARHCRDALAAAAPEKRCEERVNGWFAANVPVLETENEDLKKIYYYRYYLLYRSIHTPRRLIKNHFIPGQCMYESPFGGWYGCPVGLPFPMHLEEAAWIRDATVGRDDSLNWAAGLGNYRHYIQFGIAAMYRFWQQRRDGDYLAAVYPACREAVLPLCREGEGLDLLPVTYGSWGTGAEYQPNFYQDTVDCPWDWREDVEGKNFGWKEDFAPLYRLDTVCYAIGNLQGCAAMAQTLGKEEDAQRFSRTAQNMAQVVREHFFSRKDGVFYAVSPRSGKQTDLAMCYDSFAPFLFGIAGEEYASGLAPLLSAERFRTPFGGASCDSRTPMYWFDNCLAGPAFASEKEPHPYGCSWNGPVWPYANTLMLKALGNTATTPERKRDWLSFFADYTDLHFLGGDPSLPMAVEHYRGADGSNFSPVSDYFHSEWIHLFMTYYAGISPDTPEEMHPFSPEDFTLRGVPVGGRLYTYSQKQGVCTVTLCEEN